uniref:magnesium/cobalt transporter CorA n=1 Tax=Fulvivirga sp. TaxID=1931237 RepID=UPI00404943B2
MLTLIQYNDPGYIHNELERIVEAAALIKSDYINWIDIEITNEAIVKDAEEHFKIHHLITEDIINMDEIPKFELFDDYLFFSTKMLSFDLAQKDIREEHLSIVMGSDFVITFQEGIPGDAFHELRNRIKLGKGLIRKYKQDYLFYLFLDAVVDHYLVIMETLRKRIEALEEGLMADKSYDVMEEVIRIKKDINHLRKYALPMRDALNKMRVEAAHFIQKSSINYYQDVADHIHFLIASFETSREMLKDIMDLHHSNQNNEMNRVMKTLTVVSAIFIPLTFLAGVYGMNFRYMPELEWEWGYQAVWIEMGVVALVMIMYMRYRRWF